MSKLRRLPKSDDSWQKCCRWCHHYKDGKCMNENTYTAEEDLGVYKVSEDGHLDQCLEETLGSVPLHEFKELEYLLRGYKLSEKKIKEFNDLFQKCWEEFSQGTLKEELEYNISICYLNNVSNTLSEGVYIEDPENFCCKDWS